MQSFGHSLVSDAWNKNHTSFELLQKAPSNENRGRDATCHLSISAINTNKAPATSTATMQEQQESSKAETKLPVLERFALRKEGESLSPVCVIVVGMAGSGKTSLMAQLQRSLQAHPQDTNHTEKEEELQDLKLPAKEKDNDDERRTRADCHHHGIQQQQQQDWILCQFRSSDTLGSVWSVD